MELKSTEDIIADICEAHGFKLVYRDSEWHIQIDVSNSVRLQNAYAVMFIHNMGSEEFLNSLK